MNAIPITFGAVAGRSVVRHHFLAEEFLSSIPTDQKVVILEKSGINYDALEKWAKEQK